MMIKVGLIGYPLTHSFSKKHFDEKFLKGGIDAGFDTLEIESLTDIRTVIEARGWKGFSVTIPHKVAILPYLDRIDDTAKGIGAVNCVKVIEGGRWIGYNTDIIGFTESIKPMLAPHHTNALIIGNGGAAQAVKAGLDSLGITYSIVGRDKRKCDFLFIDLDKRIIEAHSIIINTTPLGTYPDVDTFPQIPFEYINSNHLLYDLVYNPSITKFLQLGMAQGAAIKNGLEMLQLQAEAAWDIWNKDE